MKSVVTPRTTTPPPAGQATADGGPHEARGSGVGVGVPVGPLGLDLVAALLLWPELDERCFRLVSRCLGEQRQLDWVSFRDALLRDGWIEPTARPGVFRVTALQLPPLQVALERLGGPGAIAEALVAGQARTQDPALLEDLALWAEASRAWRVLELFWITLSEADVALTPTTLRVVRDVPLEARRAHPILTWASGAAGALLASSPQERNTALMDRLLFDSALIHGDWSLHDDTDTAVLAGTFRLIGQGRMPTAGGRRGVEAAWATKLDLDAFIDDRTARGRGPGRIAHSVFRAFSARLAILRGDFAGAIQEAHVAQVLSSWRPVSVLAHGIEELARALAFDLAPAAPAELPVIRPSELGMRGLSGMGTVFQLLAAGHRALARLDRDEVGLVLDSVSMEAAEAAGLWAVRTALAAFREAVWGDPAEGLSRLLAEVAHRPVMVNEQDEPLGRTVLGRAGVLLLTKTGAMAAARQSVEQIPAAFRAVAAARTALWAGQKDEAVRIAEAGLLRSDLRPADRSRLVVIAVAASLRDGSTPDRTREVVRALDDLVDAQILLPLAALPTAVRDPLVQLYIRNHGVGEDAVANLLQRLSELNDAGSADAPVRLTPRELQLLPLLAGDDSIPAIAKVLQVSVHTVRTQVATLREKFHAGSRSDLVRQAVLLGAISGHDPAAGRGSRHAS